MNIFVEIFDGDGRCCTFYTVRKEGASLSETEKFLLKYREDPRHRRSLQELVSFLDIISNKYGARASFFRFEDQAHALPPSGARHFGEVLFDFGGYPLRLYCLRLRESLVILFNGGEKTSQRAQEGQTASAFREAKAFADKIDRALIDREIHVSRDGRRLVSAEGEEDALYL